MHHALQLLRHHLAQPASSWSVGEFGALAEYHHAGGDRVDLDALTLSSPGGALRVERASAPHLLAYETPSANPRLWNHGVAFCLPEAQARMHGRGVLTELGQDQAAIRADARGHLLFDIGLGLATADFCIRTYDAQLIALLRGAVGRNWFEHPELNAAVLAASPARVVISRLARIEIDNPIPRPNQASPDGPHTHVLPDLLKRHRVHDASIPVPAGCLPCLTLYPQHPARDAEGRERPFEPAAHAAFQSLLEQHGDATFVAAKHGTVGAAAGRVAHLGHLIAGRQRALLEGRA